PSLFIQAPLNQPSDGISFTIVNAGKGISGELLVNNGKKRYRQKIELGADSEKNISVASRYLIPGSNTVRILSGKKLLLDTLVQNWSVPADNLARMETVNLSSQYNEDLNRILQSRYLSPRPSSTTLQIPAQGIGNWCYPLSNPDIDDSG